MNSFLEHGAVLESFPNHNLAGCLSCVKFHAHEVPLLDNPGINSPRAPGVWLAHENGHIMSVGTRGNYIWALGAHR